MTLLLSDAVINTTIAGFALLFIIPVVIVAWVMIKSKRKNK